jgi:hypothetical protein
LRRADSDVPAIDAFSKILPNNLHTDICMVSADLCGLQSVLLIPAAGTFSDNIHK